MSYGISHPRRPTGANDDVDFVYRIDVHQGPDNTVVASFELPGLKKDDVNIELHNDRLTVSGESKHLEERIECRYVVRERRFGKFTRSLPLPQGTICVTTYRRMVIL